MKVSLTRKYMFSAAHRLDSPFLNEADNIEIYEKCNNINGHGHDYTLEVTICGKPNNLTGMILPLPEFDQNVKDVINKIEHKHINKEVEYFQNRISTAEYIIQYLWDELNKSLPENLLHHLKLWETNNNYFEFGKEKAS
ncbi:MAG: 6-carboxytetrahydropterin synthase [Calditrichaeota bacterium]|nr:MAG: 6-carboxytetrahydropterin synthase [Calditrichota bacterium]MBL1205101.1 6-carboxytetrahydropterin synthase [Calditrichota bacterium]NOG44931.1 6-carboxytetrahydropterin synthase [Calditrichota bacterium]